MRKSNLDTIKYILISVLIFVVAVVVADIMRIILIGFDFLSLSVEQASLIATMIEGAVGAIAAGFVLYELKINGNVQDRENDIEEAQFILQYNQSFIQDEKMYETERLLERWMIRNENKTNPDEMLITDNNIQSFVNYLVYLEGLAPLIFRGILRFEHIDDLMAYRFFLAINNPCVQRVQIFAFPDYYRGCIKLYKDWKKYREINGLPILLERFSLDNWEKFGIYSSDIKIRKYCEHDNYRDVAGLIYETDPFIYPSAFGNKSRAKHILQDLLSQACVFNRKNIRVAVKDGEVYGMALIVANKELSLSPECFKKAKQKSVQSVDKQYFSKISDLITDNQAYIACICVSEKYRGNGIGELLLKSIIYEFEGTDLVLDVLDSNKNAINLYKKCGFKVTEQTNGYAKTKRKPVCYRMIRPRG